MRSSVVLPVPFAPVTTRASPASTRNETPVKSLEKPRRAASFCASSMKGPVWGPSRGTAAFGRVERDAPPEWKIRGNYSRPPRDPCAASTWEPLRQTPERACYHGTRPSRPGASHARQGNSCRLARVSPAIPAGKDLGPADQGSHQSARPRARLHSRRGGGLRRDRPRPRRGAQPDRARQPGRRRHQRHCRAGAGRHRSRSPPSRSWRARPSCSRSSPASTVSTSRSTSATRTSWSTSSPRSSRRSAASISRTSRRRNASTSRRSCASASRSRCSTMTSTARRSSSAPRSRTACASSARS